jgi:tripartite-type tricarboxylate transporter receptor subunit TctC
VRQPFAIRYSLFAATFFFFAVAVAAAQSPGWPPRPVKVLVPFAAGGNIDVMGRLAAARLSEAFSQQFVVENRVGGNGVIATEAVARASADGTTLLWASTSVVAIFPAISKVGYDPVKDFAPITRTGSFTQVLVINPTVPAKSLPELIAYAKANPGQLAYASGNTSGILAGETLKRWAGIDVLHVPYKSVPPALNDVIGGRVAMAFSDLSPVLPHVAAGSLRPLGITRLRRSALLPDLPTFDESGLKDFEVESWAGLFAPAGTPAPIVARLNAGTRAILENSQIKAQLARIGFEAFATTPEELGAFVKEQLVRTFRMAREAGIEPE